MLLDTHNQKVTHRNLAFKRTIIVIRFSTFILQTRTVQATGEKKKKKKWHLLLWKPEKDKLY